MSKCNVIVPPLGESVSEATVAKWYKNVGEFVNKDEILVELETEKVTLEVNAPESGFLNSITKGTGSVVSRDEILCCIDISNAKDHIEPSKELNITQGYINKSNPDINQNNDSLLSPAAKKVIVENHLDLSLISGTGRDGRITKGDAFSLLDKAAGDSKAKEINNSVSDGAPLPMRKIRMTNTRKTIAKRLKESQNTAAILTTFNEIDMSAVMSIRNKYKDEFEKIHSSKIGFMSFFVKATIKALKAIPALNSEIEGEYIIYKDYYDIGVAVGTENGLVVPVLRNADSLSMSEIEKAIANLGKKARDGKLSISELSGGTFSITNGGTYGSLLSTPIINPPQSGILGMHNIVPRPVAIGEKIEIRPMMYVALSYDHRIVDGKEAVTFLVNLKKSMESPERLLLDL